jgi:hypothetical protein
MKRIVVLTLPFLLLRIGLFAQGITIGSGTTFSLGSATLYLPNNWNNSGTLKAENGTIVFNGASETQSLTGSNTFTNLTVNKTNGIVQLQSNITVNGILTLTHGDADLNGKSITLGENAFLSETAGNTVIGDSGYLTTTRSLNAPTALNVAGLGAILTNASDLGSTVISRSAVVQRGGSGVSIKRYYDITPSNNSGLNATLTFLYDESELNGVTENELQLYTSKNSGASWRTAGGTLDTSSNSITTNGVNSFFRWTLASSVNSLLDADTISAVSITNISSIDTTHATIRCNVHVHGRSSQLYIAYGRCSKTYTDSICVGTISADTALIVSTVLNGLLKRSKYYCRPTLISVSTYTIDTESYFITNSCVTDSLTAWYPFFNNANDETKNGYDALLIDAVSGADRFGNANNGYVFSGSGKIAMPHIPFDNRSFSISLWMNRTSTDDMALLQENATDATDQLLHVVIRTNKIGFNFYGDDLVGNTDIAAGTWYCFTFVYDADSSMKKIYVNGILDARGLSSAFQGTSGNMEIGCYFSTPYTFSGTMDEIRFYHKVLSEVEIQALYNDNLTFSGDLPVQLTSFTASTTSMATTLNWTTATETNNYGFDVERRIIEAESSKSQNTNTNWSKIGFVAGNGTSNSAHSYSYTDASVSSGTYAYRLKQIDNDGTYKYSNEAEVTLAVPTVFALNQNYPNPFNPSTVIGYQLPVSGSVTLKVYDVVGREVATLVNETKSAGSYQVTFNASKLASGVYFYKLQSGSYTSVKKLVLMK